MRERVEIIGFKDEMVLLGENSNNGHFMFPGGGIEESEHLFNAARRECQEETGFGIQNLVVLGDTPFIDPEHKEITIFCMGDLFNEKVTTAIDKMNTLVFVDYKNAIDLLSKGNPWPKLHQERLDRLSEAFSKKMIKKAALKDIRLIMPLKDTKIKLPSAKNTTQNTTQNTIKEAELSLLENSIEVDIKDTFQKQAYILPNTIDDIKYTIDKFLYLKKEAQIKKRVEVVILDDNNKMLGGISPRHGWFMFPGGGIEEDEDILEAAKREAGEEAGVNVEPIKIINEDLPILRKFNSKPGYSATYMVLAKLKKGKSKNLGADNDTLLNLKYYSPEEMGPLSDLTYLPPRFELFKKENLIPQDYVQKVAELFMKDSVVDNFIKKAALVTTVGQAIINSTLPDDLKDYSKRYDKKVVKKTLQAVAEKYPEQFPKVLDNFYKYGDHASLFSIRHLRYDDFARVIDPTKKLEIAKKEFEKKRIELGNDNFAMADVYSKVKDDLTKEAVTTGGKSNNNLAIMAISGARGSPEQFTDITVGPILLSDYKNRPIPIVIDKGYSQGLTPAQYFAASYGTRRGMISTKMMVPLAGYMSKMLGWTLADQVVTEDDCKTKNGNTYSIDDKWNIGKFLAKQTDKYPANTLLTDSILNDIKAKGIKTLVIRSPISCESRQGICSKCLGKTEIGQAPIGYNGGLNSSAALSEPLTQATLSEKHTGGTIKKRVGGFELIEQLVKIPSTFKNEAKMAEKHGTIEDIKESDWGGWDIKAYGENIHTTKDNPPIVKIGDKIEKGDLLTEGVPNPAKLTSLVGWGPGRKILANTLRNTFLEMGPDLDRTHYEVTSRGLINFGEANKKVGMLLPNEIGKLDDIKKDLTFKNAQEEVLRSVKPFNIYLARQELYYMPGTEITEKVKNELLNNGITKVWTTTDKLPVTPLMVRVEDSLMPDRDWIQRMASQGLKSTLVKGIQRGDFSPYKGLKYVHPYIRGKDFGVGTKFY